MVCHDCCCGTTTKHPTVDHEAQRHAVRRCASDRVRVREVECLDECDRSNVVLVRDHRLPRRERDTWLGRLLTSEETDALTRWLTEDGPLPEELTRRRFVHIPPYRRSMFGPPEARA
ncbi:hypothetical protein GCM10011519_25430 [Marmoricola endophyticus]|uniref:(2Fe-2S) ferredoxin domain-containing protein n=1 Tax=Marmoricola endophyticus TaxID=2040280 RepID=A0A917BL60_9ACTN|nr:(2Fe-2S) ferredoxin domain-containing protein [Marmoricola endophyticus]GGF50392.1 hypothetical protein GCM10011519_25430 [Marmoricola endophyticus]